MVASGNVDRRGPKEGPGWQMAASTSALNEVQAKGGPSPASCLLPSGALKFGGGGGSTAGKRRKRGKMGQQGLPAEGGYWGKNPGALIRRVLLFFKISLPEMQQQMQRGVGWGGG